MPSIWSHQWPPWNPGKPRPFRMRYPDCGIQKRLLQTGRTSRISGMQNFWLLCGVVCPVVLEKTALMQLPQHPLVNTKSVNRLDVLAWRLQPSVITGSQFPGHGRAIICDVYRVFYLDRDSRHKKIGNFTTFSIPLKRLGPWDSHNHSEVNNWIDSMPKLPLTS